MSRVLPFSPAETESPALRRKAVPHTVRVTEQPATLLEAARFWAKAARPPIGCWEWQFSLNKFGYGKLGWKRKTCAAHRIAWWLTYGPIPEGLHVCHRCNNKRCVRPDHLYLATDDQNRRDAIRDGLFKRPLRQPSKLTPAQVM